MAIENVVCPNCGREALATLPAGQRLLEIWKEHKSYSDAYTQTCRCKSCGRTFFAITKNI